MENSSKNRVVETKTQKIWLSDEGILFFESLINSNHTLEDAREGILVGLELTNHKRVPALIDIRKIKSVTREARNYYTGEETFKLQSASAILIDSPLSKLIANFFLGLNKVKIPTRLFTSESEALQWLKGFKV